MKKTGTFRILAAAFLLIALSGCETTDVEEQPAAAAPQPQQQAKWQAATSLRDIVGSWAHDDGSGYDFPVTVDGAACLAYHTPLLDRTQYWADIASQYGYTFEELWEQRAGVRFSDDKGNTFPVTDENGTRYSLRIIRDSSTGAIYFQYWYHIPQAVAARNLGFFCMSPDKQRFFEQGSFSFGGTKINALQKGNQIYRKK